MKQQYKIYVALNSSFCKGFEQSISVTKAQVKSMATLCIVTPKQDSRLFQSPNL